LTFNSKFDTVCLKSVNLFFSVHPVGLHDMKTQNHISQSQNLDHMTSLPEAAIASCMDVNGDMTQSFRAVKFKIRLSQDF